MSKKSTGCAAIARASSLRWMMMGSCITVGILPAWSACAGQPESRAADAGAGDSFGLAMPVNGGTSTSTGFQLPQNGVCALEQRCSNVEGAPCAQPDGSDCPPNGTFQCSNYDTIDGGICVEQCCLTGGTLTVDIELGITNPVPACGAQLFLSYDRNCLDFAGSDTDPDDELGWTFTIVNSANEAAGTIDVIIALPPGTVCNGVNGTVSGGTITRLTFNTISECECGGVSFRPHNPPNGVGGPGGSIPIVGCDGLALVGSGAGEILIPEPPVWTCPDSVADGSAYCETGGMVDLGELAVLDACGSPNNPPVSNLCTVSFEGSCDDDLDCGVGPLCGGVFGPCAIGTCAPLNPSNPNSPTVCTVYDCIDGLCPAQPGDPSVLSGGVQSFSPGITSVSCSHTNECGQTAVCAFSIVNNGLPDVAGCADQSGPGLCPDESPCSVGDPLACGGHPNDCHGRRDDNCKWWTCDPETICRSTNVKFADMGSAGGVCGPDGTVDGHDKFHALNCFSDTNFGGPGEYTCEPFGPDYVVNVDAGGAGGSCCPDGSCDANDIFAALNAFAGTGLCSNCPQDTAICVGGGKPGVPCGNDAACLGGTCVIQNHMSHPCPPEGPSPISMPPPVGVTTITASADQRAAQPGDLVSVNVFMDNAQRDLRGYQLHLSVTGGVRGRMELVDISVRDRVDRVFAHTGYFDAFNVRTGQMIAGLDGVGVRTADKGYLATYTYRVSNDAAGAFVADVLGHATDSPWRRSFLFASGDGTIAIVDTKPAIIEVRPRH